ncbi:MAG TPA: site-specific DNA-methyltransferase [Polyangiaceae bacterium]
MVARTRSTAPRLNERSGATPARVFSREPGRSIGPAAPGENRLVHGDNLEAMQWLAAEGFAGKFRCAYVDPPYNSGRQFKEYDDALPDDEWCEAMRPRLEAVRALLAEDGALFAEIDDTMLSPLHRLLDETFGRANRVSSITLVRSASTGHKAANRGPVNVSAFLLVYARTKGGWRSNPLWRERGGYDAAYSTFIPNRDAPESEWRFEPLRAHGARSLGYADARTARRALGSEGFAQRLERFALENAARVVRFAQPRVEAVSREAQAWIARSKREPQATFRLARPGFKDMILHGGNRVLFLADKVRTGERGQPVLVEPLTNVWTDVPFQGIAREGGVVFSRNKKPERLLERALSMATDEGDWVLDPFLGSGTTAAVAHKMGRRWVGIERGVQQFDGICAPRLARVASGEDKTGITRARKWAGGGGFGVYV